METFQKEMGMHPHPPFSVEHEAKSCQCQMYQAFREGRLLQLKTLRFQECERGIQLKSSARDEVKHVDTCAYRP